MLHWQMIGSILSFFTYIVECADGSFYTGYATDVERRIKTHNSGRGARYTRMKGPVKLLAYWSFDTRAEAMSFERRVKQLSKDQKTRLIVENWSRPQSSR